MKLEAQVAKLTELAEDWSVIITTDHRPDGRRFTLVITSYRSGFTARYVGEDLELLIARAHAGEPSDA